jgi:hypothetical protein
MQTAATAVVAHRLVIDLRIYTTNDAYCVRLAL